jgi:hypothetical protein
MSDASAAAWKDNSARWQKIAMEYKEELIDYQKLVKEQQELMKGLYYCLMIGTKAYLQELQEVKH